MTALSDESRDLVARASRGDRLAVDTLLQRHLPGLRVYVRARISASLRSVESASDVVQSVCRDVLEGLEAFEYRGEAAFRGWLHKAALRKLVDHERFHTAKKRDGRVDGEPQQGAMDFASLASTLRSPSGEAMLREDVATLERGFDRLTPDERDILRWVFVEGATHAQIARCLGCSDVASRKRLSRALARLSRLLA